MLDQHAPGEPEVEDREQPACVNATAELRLHVIVQRIASAKGAKRGTAPCESECIVPSPNPIGTMVDCLLWRSRTTFIHLEPPSNEEL
jgi:hypothetical protein